MRITKNIKWISSATLILIACGCSKNFLEEKVDNRSLITTLDEMEAAVENLNPRADALFTEYMTDEYVYKDLPSHVIVDRKEQIEPVYTFRITKESLPGSAYSLPYFNPNLSWLRYYYRIQNSLLIIHRATGYEAKGPDEEKLKASIIGRALAIKAYCNFMLVSLFAKSYDPATAAEDPGIPLASEYTGKAIEKSPVASVQETYDAIESDLLAALPMLNDKELSNTEFNFTTISVNALLSRLYLFKKDYKKAIEYSNLVIKESSSLLDIRELFNEHPSDHAERSKQYFNPDQESYLLMSENTRTLLSSFRTGFYPYALQNFMRSEGRTSPRHFIQTSPLFEDIIPLKVLYFFRASAVRRNTGIFPLLSVDEVYYNRAEANVQLGNFGKAKQDLQLLLSKDDYYNTGWTGKLSGLTDKEALMSYLLYSKLMRFYGEGMRWFDMKRHLIPVTHQMLGNTFAIDGTNPEDYVIKPPLEELDN